MNIAAFDPGISTGFAIVSCDGLVIDYGTIRQLHTFEKKKQLAEILDAHRVQVIVFEKYIGRTDADVETLGAIHNILEYATTHGISIIEQRPLDRKPFEAEAQNLIPAGVQLRKHCIDALAHALRYVEVQRRMAA